MIERLRLGHDFRRLRQEGTRVRRGVIWCTMLPDATIESPRIAFAIGRSVGPAVTRNRIRRRLREVIRRTPLVPGLYLFGLTRDASREPSFSEITDALGHISAKAAEVAA